MTRTLLLHRAGKKKFGSATQMALCSRVLLKSWSRCLSQAPSMVAAYLNGTSLFYTSQGSSEDVLLCLPGFLGTAWTDFSPQLEELSKDYTVVSLDPVGCGLSQPPMRDFFPTFQKEDADYCIELMKYLGHEKYFILGWDDACATATFIAHQEAESVRGMVLWGGYSYVDEPELKMFEAAIDANTRVHDGLKRLLVEEEIKYMSKQWLQAIKAIASGETGGDIVYDVAGDVLCPALVLTGEKETLVPSCHTTVWTQILANSGGRRVKEAGHDLHLTHPEEFHKIVRGFIRQVKVIENTDLEAVCTGGCEICTGRCGGLEG